MTQSTESFERAYTLRHSAMHNSRSGDFFVAQTEIEEAIAIYRSDRASDPLDLANALRISALNHLHQALPIWREAHDLYQHLNIQPGVDESRRHLQYLTELPHEH